MGKISTEGIGEVQEFIDIVSSKWGRRATVIDQPMFIVIRIGNNGGNTRSVTMQLAFRE
jgi:hypothetical protein